MAGEKRGRKSKYFENIRPNLAKIREYKMQGATDEQICSVFDISQSSFYEYKKKYPEFSEAIKKGIAELVLDLRGELVKAAKNHTLETKKQYIRQDLDTGVKIQYTEITTREVDGDVAAINLLLKNLDRDNWANDPQVLSLRQQELELRKAIAEANNFDIDIK